MSTLLPALIGVICGAIVTGIGWFVTHNLTVKREELARRDNAAREYLESQIQELYGPLLGLIQHSRIVIEVAAKILPACSDVQLNFSRFSERDGKVWRFFVESYLLPQNEEILQLIRSRMFLLKDGLLPKSFEDFFVYATQFEVFHQLWKETGIDVPDLSWSRWPPEFGPQVQATLDHLREQHQMFLQRLGAIEDRSESAANGVRAGGLAPPPYTT